jgi:hypothetical protein
MPDAMKEGGTMDTIESKIIIKTDHKWKNFLYGYELTAKEKAEFDYMTDEDIDCGSFIRYRKWIYSLEDFMRIENNPALAGWSGYSSDSFFSGVVMKISDDGEQYKVGTYIS